MQTSLVKTCDFLFYGLSACNKKAEILPLTIALVAHLHGQFNLVFSVSFYAVF